MKLSFSLFLQASLVLITITANAADFRIIAENGKPAADFPSDSTYQGLENPVIGGGGHIAFMGAARSVSQNSTSHAVWSGKPGQLKTVIKEGDSPNGFIASTLFSRAVVSNLNTLLISDSGSVAFRAKMVGSKTGDAILATVNGTTFGIIQVGSPAPGFPVGTIVMKIYNFAFTDAGLVIQGGTSTGEYAIWFWNNNTLDLVISSRDEIADFYPGCNSITQGTGLGPTLGGINQQGEILFMAFLKSDDNEVVCPPVGLFTWKAGVFKKIVVANDIAPGMPVNSYFSSVGMLFLAVGAKINANGEVLFPATVKNGNSNQLDGWWVARKNGEIEPIVFHGETLPGFPNESIGFGGFVGFAGINDNAFSVVKPFSSVGSDVILVGPPKQAASYSDFSDLGESHLKLLVHPEFQPPGFSPTWYFKEIGQPLINNQNTIIFWAGIRDALDSRASIRGIWLGNENAELRLLLAEEQAVEIGGESQTFSRIDDISKEISLSGSSNQFNDQDQLIFTGTTNLHQDAIFYYGINDEPVEPDEPDCIATYETNGFLNIPCVSVPDTSLMYEGEMKLNPFSNPLAFELIQVQANGETSITNDCVTSYQIDGTLSIPCVTVPDASGDTVMYEAELKLIPSSNPLAFELTGAQPKN